MQVRVNGGNWQTAIGTASWSKNVTLSVGANTLEARSLDNVGLYSPIIDYVNIELDENTLEIVYVDFDETESGDGTPGSPLRTLDTALHYVTFDGTGSIQMQNGISGETFVGANAINPGGRILLTANNGPVYIGLPPLQDRLSNALDRFSQFDADGDGVLSFRESGLTLSEFDAINTDSGDGGLTLEELLVSIEFNPNNTGVVWVDFDAPANGVGSSDSPFNLVRDARDAVNVGGYIGFMTSRNTDETIVISKAMRLVATAGSVQIGVASSSLVRGADSEDELLADSADISGESENSDGTGTGSSTDSDTERESFNTAIFEAVVPNTINADGDIMVLADGRLALRLRDFTGLEFESLWAELDPEHSSEEVSFDWKPVVEGDDRDIWVFFSPTETWYLNDLLVIVAGGMSSDGVEILSDIHTVQVESVEELDAHESEVSAELIAQPDYTEANEGIGHDAALTAAADVPPISVFDTTVAYRIEPDHVFDEPQRIRLPVPDGIDPAAIELMYYKGNEPNQRWHRADSVVGFLAEIESVNLTDASGRTWLGVVVNHAGIVQLGAPEE